MYEYSVRQSRQSKQECFEKKRILSAGGEMEGLKRQRIRDSRHDAEENKQTRIFLFHSNTNVEMM